MGKEKKRSRKSIRRKLRALKRKVREVKDLKRLYYKSMLKERRKKDRLKDKIVGLKTKNTRLRQEVKLLDKKIDKPPSLVEEILEVERETHTIQESKVQSKQTPLLVIDSPSF